jgi:hypothetical protein
MKGSRCIIGIEFMASGVTTVDMDFISSSDAKVFELELGKRMLSLMLGFPPTFLFTSFARVASRAASCPRLL